ncbi:HIT family protein [Desulfothermus naphthae]
MECIFCKIVRGEIPCAEVYSDDNILAFLDIAPISKGHTLVIPKDHYENLFDMPEELGNHFLKVMKILGLAIMKTTGATGINVVMNNYSSAGQVVPHAHWHLVPRIEGDGLFRLKQNKYDSDEDMVTLATKIKEYI